MSGTDFREKAANDASFDPKTAYITSQVAHITCKKDISVENNLLTYSLSTGDHTNGFCMRHTDDIKLPMGSEIILTIPSFNIFITGDLSYYADVLGMPASTSYWCPFCLLSRPEWQQSADANGDERTAEFQRNTYTAIMNDRQKKMTPMKKKGVSSQMHYKCLTPQHFVPPLLHLEIGMVNQSWDDLEQWMDDKVEIIPSHEKDARNKLKDAIENLDLAAREKKDAERTINIEVCEKNAEVKVLRKELRRRGINDTERQELSARITLMLTFIDEQKQLLKTSKEQLKNCEIAVAECKKMLDTLKTERGKPESSLVADVELLLKTFAIERDKT
jgi:predicted RNA binding protein with dsRBD fold (UPF0201 family)